MRKTCGRIGVLRPRDPDGEYKQGDRESEDAIAKGFDPREVPVLRYRGITLVVVERASGVRMLFRMRPAYRLYFARYSASISSSCT